MGNAHHQTGNTTQPRLMKDGTLCLSRPQLKEWINDLVRVGVANASLHVSIDAEVLPKGVVTEEQASQFVLCRYGLFPKRPVMVLQAESGENRLVELSALENDFCRIMLSGDIEKGTGKPWDEIFERIYDNEPDSEGRALAEKNKRRIQNVARRVNKKCSEVIDAKIEFFACKEGKIIRLV